MAFLESINSLQCDHVKGFVMYACQVRGYYLDMVHKLLSVLVDNVEHHTEVSLVG